MSLENEYAIGSPGVPWGDAEKATWLGQQKVQRSYAAEVINKINRVAEQHQGSLKVEQYGTLNYGELSYPLLAIVNSLWRPSLPNILITGGVHGYETSGVQGALRFAESGCKEYQKHFNFVVAPCISPWAYETINRWNPHTIDPNRSFSASSEAQETALFMEYIDTKRLEFWLHIDLHETTDTDNSEFRPALAARDAKHQETWDIPDGFYCVGDTLKPAPEFQEAIIKSVERVTHIAEEDKNGKLIGEEIEQKGVINYPTKQLGLCAGYTDAPYVTTTEVYPDSPKVNDENCTQSQVAAITGALEFLIEA